MPITAEEEYEKNPEISKEKINEIRKWMATQPHLPQNVPGESAFRFSGRCTTIWLIIFIFRNAKTLTFILRV